MLCYADDVVLFADTKNNLQIVLHTFNITKQNNIGLSTKKTKSMILSKEPVRQIRNTREIITIMNLCKY